MRKWLNFHVTWGTHIVTWGRLLKHTSIVTIQLKSILLSQRDVKKVRAHDLSDKRMTTISCNLRDGSCNLRDASSPLGCWFFLHLCIWCGDHYNILIQNHQIKHFSPISLNFNDQPLCDTKCVISPGFSPLVDYLREAKQYSLVSCSSGSKVV